MAPWLVAWSSLAVAQTVQQSETSLKYLGKTVCLESNGAGLWRYTGGIRTLCYGDPDCAAPGTCEHESLVVAATTLYDDLEFPGAPTNVGSGEGILRFVPLCEDGSGDHEYSVSGGALGTPPTCAPASFIRCGAGERPLYRLDAGWVTPRSDHFLFHVGPGGPWTAPGVGDPIWLDFHSYATKAYVAPEKNVHAAFDGIYSEDRANPFSAVNRVKLERCSTDNWMGDADVVDLQDFTTDQMVSVQAGWGCWDADRNGVPNCDDNLAFPGSCQCVDRVLAAPKTPNQGYSVFFHGRRIVRAVIADIGQGAIGYTNYPLVDDGTGHARVQAGDERLGRIVPGSIVAFTCHSSGCESLQGGLLDEYHARLDSVAGGDVDVRGVLNGHGAASVEAEACVSEYDGVDVAPQDFVADHPGVIDDACSVYDGLIDTVAISGEPMSTRVFEPGGRTPTEVDAWFAGRPGYLPPIDASCLAHHCPGRAWTDLRCAPCLDSTHVMLNHLQTPFAYHQSQRDQSQVRQGSWYCDRDPEVACDNNGDRTRVNLADSHWRPLARKEFADLFRYGETDRCEGGPGNEAPYDHLLLMLPDRDTHASLLDDATALYPLDLDGPLPPRPMGAALWTWMTTTSPAAPRKVLCSEEQAVGENAADFTAGGVPGCQ